MNKHALWNALKEPLRLVVLALIPFGLVYFSDLPAEWAVGAVVVLRFIDKWLWELGKVRPARESSRLDKGLTRF